MSSPETMRLSRIIRQKTEEMVRLCEGIDKALASRAPTDRWSPKQIISHLCGPEGTSVIAAVRAFLEQDTPSRIHLGWIWNLPILFLPESAPGWPLPISSQNSSMNTDGSRTL